MPDFGPTKWHNPPPEHGEADGGLTLRTGKDTDYWNNTFYGFKHDNGHFRATQVGGDFSMEISFVADYRTLYDQAGAMVWVDGENWLKCGIEFTDGALHFSVVVTREDQSDWSVMPYDGSTDQPVTLRVTRHAEALRVQVQGREGDWRLVRLCFLPMPDVVEAGPMACSPTSEGLDVRFSRIAIGEAISRDLH